MHPAPANSKLTPTVPTEKTRVMRAARWLRWFISLTSFRALDDPMGPYRLIPRTN
jgi:hypothetical protein